MLRKLIPVVLLAVFCGTLVSSAMAAESVIRLYREPKTVLTPGGALLWVRLIDTAAADTDRVVSAEAATDEITTYTFTAAENDSVDIARTIDITISAPAQNDSAIAASTATLTGRNVLSGVITETFTFTEDTAGTIAGTKAFQYLSSLSFPAQDSATGVVYSVGIGSKVGLPIATAVDPVLHHYVDATRVAAHTTTVSNSAIESNTFTDGSNAWDGAKDFDIPLLICPYGEVTAKNRR